MPTWAAKKKFDKKKTEQFLDTSYENHTQFTDNPKLNVCRTIVKMKPFDSFRMQTTSTLLQFLCSKFVGLHVVASELCRFVILFFHFYSVWYPWYSLCSVYLFDCSIVCNQFQNRSRSVKKSVCRTLEYQWLSVFFNLFKPLGRLTFLFMALEFNPLE